jgi:manganese/iron transport system permease protein
VGVGADCAFLSAYLMLKGWSLIGDALSHAIVPWVAGAYMLGVPFALGAFLSGGLAAASMLFLNQRTGLKEDAIIGVIFTSFFGLGLFMISVSPTPVDVKTIILGNVLAISPGDTLLLAIIGFVSLAALLAKWKDLLIHAFDPAHARAIGLPVGALHYGLLAVISLTIVATLKAVGLILAIGLLIAPGAIAFLLAREFRRMLSVAVAATVTAMLGGVYLSFWLDSAPAPTIILLLSGAFAGAFLWRQLRTRRKTAQV